MILLCPDEDVGWLSTKLILSILILSIFYSLCTVTIPVHTYHSVLRHDLGDVLHGMW